MCKIGEAEESACCFVTCPYPACNEIVSQTLVDSLVDGEAVRLRFHGALSRLDNGCNVATSAHDSGATTEWEGSITGLDDGDDWTVTALNIIERRYRGRFVDYGELHEGVSWEDEWEGEEIVTPYRWVPSEDGSRMVPCYVPCAAPMPSLGGSQ